MISWSKGYVNFRIPSLGHCFFHSPESCQATVWTRILSFVGVKNNFTKKPPNTTFLVSKWVATAHFGLGSYEKFQVNSSDILVSDQAGLVCFQLEAISDSPCFLLDSCLIICWQVISIVQGWNLSYRKEDLQGAEGLVRSSCVTGELPGSWQVALRKGCSWATALTSMPRGGEGHFGGWLKSLLVTHSKVQSP